jgi:hypothetical protein
LVGAPFFWWGEAPEGPHIFTRENRQQPTEQTRLRHKTRRAVAQRYTTARRVVDRAESSPSGRSLFSDKASRPFGSLAPPKRSSESVATINSLLKKMARSLDEAACSVFTRCRVTHRGGQSPYAAKGRYMVVSRLCHQTWLSLNQMRVSMQKHL